MTKQNFTTRIDTKAMALARKVAATERRSVTNLIEVLIFERAEKLGIEPEDEPEDD